MKLTPVDFDPFANAKRAPQLTPVDYDPFTNAAPEQPSSIARALQSLRPAYNTLEDIGQVYPALEAGANLATQAVAVPAAGVSGIAAMLAKQFGISDRDPTEVIHSVSDALTYQPHTERGQRLTGAAMYPFEKLREGANVIGETVADLPIVPVGGRTGRGATGLKGSPLAGSIANALVQITAPAAIGKGVGAALDSGARLRTPRDAPERVAPPPEDGTPAPGVIDPSLINAGNANLHARAEQAQAPGSIASLLPTQLIEHIEAAPPPAAFPAKLEPRQSLTDTHLRGATDATRTDRYRSGLRTDQDPLRTVSGGSPAQGWASATRVSRRRSPATVYRGAASELSGEHFAPESLGYNTQHPSANLGVWFTNSKRDAGIYGPNVSEHHLDLRNPKVYRVEDFPAFDSPDAARAFRQKLEKFGHDGLIITAKHLGGPTHAVAFRPEQVVRARIKREQSVDDAGAHSAVMSRRLPQAAEIINVDDSPFRGATTLEELRQRARDLGQANYAQAPKLVRVASDQQQVIVPWQGIKRAVATATNAAELRAVLSVPDLLQNARLVSSAADRLNRRNIKAVHEYIADARIGGALHQVRLVVREHSDGRRYYDHTASITALQKTKPAGISGEHQALRPDESLQPAAGLDESIAQQGAPDTSPDQIESRGPPQVNSFASGANYVGFRNDNSPLPPGPGGAAALPSSASPKPFGKGKVEPIRREDILRPFLKALGVPLYEGRVKRAGVMGFYRPKSEAVRIKNKSDLETAAHELAHLIDDRVFNGFRADKTRPKSRPWESGPKAQIYGKELRGVSYDGTKTYEGFAEFVRLWMTQHDQARLAAPEFSKWFDDFVQKNEYGPAIREAADGMQAWYDQGDLVRAESKIGPQSPLNDVLDTFFDKFRQSVFDDQHGVYKMERDLKGDIEPGGAYETARLTRAGYSLVDGALSLGAPVVKAGGAHAFEGKSLKAILDPVVADLDKWTLYAVGRSAKELFVQGREHLFARNEIRSMLELETPEFRKAFDEYQVWNKAVVDFAEAKGLINPETRKLWQRAEYLPFYRSGQGAPTKGAKGTEGQFGGIKQLKGGTGNIRSVLGNMIQNAAFLLTESLKNEARVEVANMADKLEGGGRFMTKIGLENKAVQIDREQVKRFVAEMLGVDASALKSSGSAMVPAELMIAIDKLTAEFAQQPNYIRFWLFNQSPKGHNVVAVMRGGKPTFYEVADPLLFRAIEALNRPGKHMLVRFLGAFRRVGQASITLTPDFMAANIARDTLLAGIMSKNGFLPMVESIRGMKSRITKDANYREFIANGGGLSSHLVDEQAFRRHLERFYTQKGIDYRTVLDTPAKLIDFVETLTDAFEMSTRLGEFKRAREAGASSRHAAYEAREISTDFAMRGDSQVLGVFYDTVIFLKAGMNSIDRLYRGLAHDENRIEIAAKTGLLALASMWLYAENRNNPAYAQLEDWDRDTHWHFFIRKWNVPANAPIEERYYHFRYPKIWEIGAVSSLAERALGKVLDADPIGFGKDLIRIVSDLFSFNAIPQALQPLYEQAANRDSFTKRPIETLGMESLAKWARTGPGTSQALTELGVASRNLPEELQVNPVRAEALLRGYFNTWAAYGLSLTDGALYDSKPEMRVDDYPVIKRFYRADPARHTRFETEFYDMLREATELRRTMKQMDKTGRAEIATELQAKPLQDEYKFLTNRNTTLRGIYKDQREIYADTTLSPAEKRARLDELQRERNVLFRDVVEGVNERRRMSDTNR